MLPNDNLDTKNLNLTPYLFGPKKGEYYNGIFMIDKLIKKYNLTANNCFDVLLQSFVLFLY